MSAGPASRLPPPGDTWGCSASGPAPNDALWRPLPALPFTGRLSDTVAAAAPPAPPPSALGTHGAWCSGSPRSARIGSMNWFFSASRCTKGHERVVTLNLATAQRGRCHHRLHCAEGFVPARLTARKPEPGPQQPYQSLLSRGPDMELCRLSTELCCGQACVRTSDGAAEGLGQGSGCASLGHGHSWGLARHLPWLLLSARMESPRVDFPRLPGSPGGDEITSGRDLRRSLAGLGVWVSEECAFVIQGRDPACCPSNFLCREYSTWQSWNAEKIPASHVLLSHWTKPSECLLLT